MTNGIEPMIHAQEFLELVKIAAKPMVIKKNNEKYFLKNSIWNLFNHKFNLFLFLQINLLQ